MSEGELTLSLRATAPVKQVRRIRQSQAEKLVFNTDRAPAFVSVAYTKFPIAAYLENPPQRPKYHRVRHVGGVYSKPTRCFRCGEALECTHATLKARAALTAIGSASSHHQIATPKRWRERIPQTKLTSSGSSCRELPCCQAKIPIRTTNVIEQERVLS